MRLRVALAVVAVVLFSSVSVTWAQGPGGRGPGGGFGGFGGGFGVSRLGLLRNEAVQKELELLDDQIAAIQKLQQELGGDRGSRFGGGQPGQPGQGGRPGGFGNRPGGGQPGQGGRPGGAGGRPGGQPGQGGRPGGDRQRPGSNQGTSLQAADGFQFVQQPNQPQRNFQDLSEEERQALIEQRRKEAAERAQQEKEKLAEILLPHQIKRLNEIYIQALGIGALQDAEVAKELGISDAQKTQLEEIRTANSESMRAQFQQLFQGGNGGGADREQITAKIAELRKANDDKVLAVLTAAQKQKFEALKGKPFELPNTGRGGFGGPGGGPGGAPGGRPGGAPQGNQGGRPQRPDA